MTDTEIINYINTYGEDSFLDRLQRARRQNALACGPAIHDIRVLMSIARQMGIVQGFPPVDKKAEATQ